MKTVLVFGVFDRLHPGHIAFLKEAATQGDRVVVILAQDATVTELKNRKPVQPLEVRKRALLEQTEVEVDEVIDGDLTLGTYSALERVHPDVIAFGYDQHELREDLERFLEQHHIQAERATLSPYKPNIYKSSLL